jgi:uncharacterized protein (TIGR02996 family)
MTDRDALLAAITAHPDEDAPRLIYADWLEENDQPELAEFIRVQTRYEHVSHLSAEGKRLAKREKELRAQLFGQLNSFGFASISFRRGFVWSVESGAIDFCAHASALTTDLAPAFELTLCETDEDDLTDVGEMAHCPELHRCVSLNVPCLGLFASEELLGSPYFTNLYRLNFPRSEGGPRLHAIARPTFAKLRWLNVSGSNSARGVAKIYPFTCHPELANLEYLDFSNNRMNGDDLQAFTESARAPHLRYLNLARNNFRPFGVSYFLFYNRSQKPPALAELDLSDSFDDFTDLSKTAEEPDEDERPLRPYFGRLSKLWLRNNRITDDGARILAAYSGDVSLTLLDLTGNRIGPTGKRALRERFGADVCVFE